MAEYLEDDSVLPSFLTAGKALGYAYDTGNMTNTSLRVGEVKDLIYPDSELNQNGLFIEYIVEVQHQDADGPGASNRYHGCTINNLFGGAADVLRYTLREDDGKNVGPDGIGVGSKVLLLCVNGKQTRAIILGGIRDTKVDTKTIERKEDGHNLYFEFNGTSFNIDKDGQAKFQVRGATKVDGMPASSVDQSAFPTSVEIQKNGNFLLQTKDAEQSVLIDHEKKEAKFAFEKWTCDVGSTITCKAGSNIFLKSAGVHVGSATDSWMKGTTYRTAETALHAQLTAAIAALSGLLGTAGASLVSAGALMTTPVAGAIAAAPIIGAAGGSLSAAVGALAQMTAAIATFEAQAPSYLSLKNLTD